MATPYHGTDTRQDHDLRLEYYRALLTFLWVDLHDREFVRRGAVTCGYVEELLSFEVTGSPTVPRVVEGRFLACPQRCPEGPWRLAGPGWRVRHRAATPKAPLTWEERPRRLRGTAGAPHRNDTRAYYKDQYGHISNMTEPCTQKPLALSLEVRDYRYLHKRCCYCNLGLGGRAMESQTGGRLRVKVNRGGDGVRFVLEGPLAPRVDISLLAACANEALACAARNKCLERGLALTQPCFDTLVGHNALRDCASEGFGVARKHEQPLGGVIPTDLRLTFVPSEGREPALELRGDLADRIDHALLADCANTLLACADRNECLSQGLRVQASCLEAFNGHERDVQCLTRGLGLVDVSLGSA